MGINIKQGFTDDLTKILSQQEEVLEIHEMHCRFDLLLKIRARNLEEMRDIIMNKVRNLPQITDAELMTVLKTIKEDQSVSVTKDIADRTRAAAT